MSNVLLGNKEYFPGIKQIQFEGQKSDNPFAFRWYNADQIVAGKTMNEHFKFAMAYWHSLCGSGQDPFGGATHNYPWNTSSDVITRMKDKADAAFEFMTKMGLPYYCFHDTDVVDFSNNVVDNETKLQAWAEYVKPKMAASGTKLLWGTANLFSNPRYMNGAATNPNFSVLAHGGAQVKAAIDATIYLGGENYVFWGGREGYMSLLNTDMKRELDHMASFLHAAKDYARGQGFKGTFFIEPKPCEPSKHQYDFDSATVIGFLREHNLLNDFKLNLEVNHATLAGHTFAHELQVAVDNGMLGSIDANRGDYQNGWDTDQFPNDIYEVTEAMLVILAGSGIQGGGVNFDAKRRRNSSDMADLFHAHIGAMDVFARGLITADNILQNSDYKKVITERYASFDAGKGKEFEAGKLNLVDLRNLAVEMGEPEVLSGKQEYLENIINRYI
jgi:xylose isomerase